METMETSFYPEDSFAITEKMRNMKKSMTLNLDGSAVPSKKAKFSSGCLLSTPDLTRCKLDSPHLEKLLIQLDGQITTTPTPGFMFPPKDVTEAQEDYARGFVDALTELQNSHGNPVSATEHGAGVAAAAALAYASLPSAMSANLPQIIMPPYATTTAVTTTSSSPPSAVTMSGGSVPAYLPVDITIKEEPQTVPNICSTPPLSPIDMLAQEKIKLERKRQRNRVAASKCRRRKLERIAKLEDKVKLLKSENQELGAVVTKLKDHICGLKQQLMEHVNSGCQILTPAQYLN